MCLPLLVIIWQTKEAKTPVFACKEYIFLFEVARLTDLMICVGEVGRRVGKDWARVFFCASS